ncbi:MAG: 50S ribosomal protein L18 [Chloroflexota bacterium]|jgi:large subunit ribosomal protein L18
MQNKVQARIRRHERTRKKVLGTPERPRLSVYRSLNHISAQIIDDTKSRTVVAVSTLQKELKEEKGHKGNVGMAKRVGQMIAVKALDAGVKKVVFDRSGYKYHGCIKALAEGAREAGLEF